MLQVVRSLNRLIIHHCNKGCSDLNLWYIVGFRKPYLYQRFECVFVIPRMVFGGTEPTYLGDAKLTPMESGTKSMV